MVSFGPQMKKDRKLTATQTSVPVLNAILQKSAYFIPIVDKTIYCTQNTNTSQQM